MAVRPFCNADLPQLVRLWNDHWSRIGPDPNVSIAQFEQALVARTFFRRENLLVSERDSIVGWCLLFSDPKQSTDGWIACCCLASDAGAEHSNELIAASETELRQRGTTTIRAGIAQDRSFGLAGLNPIGYGIGIPQFDTSLTSPLSSRGYSKVKSFQRVSATVTGYRPPVSRDAMQLRRSTQVDVVNFSHSDHHTAAAMSHLDIEMMCLVDRNQNVLARAHLWFSDPEAEVMNPAMAIIDLFSRQSPDQLSSTEMYLYATSIQSLVSRGTAVVESVVDISNTTLLEQLKSLNFHPSDSGDVWRKDVVA